jgi:serine protease Do
VLAGAALLLAVAAGGALVALRSRAVPAPPPAAAAPGTATAAAAAPAAAPGPALAVSTAGADRELTVEELGRAARQAVALLTCSGRLGSGFFVARDRLLTNAHVVCGKETPVQVKIGGRDLQGRVRALDAWLDWAVVEVPGAAVEAPLPLGDSTALVAGNPVVLVGSPHGLEATVHSGKVSAVPRNLQGVAHVQLNADVNPGNSGGPLLDARGHAVGIVTLKLEGASGIGFALPIEYVRGALDAPAPEAAAAGRWAAVLDAAQREDDAEAEKVLARLEKPMILAATAAGGQLGIVVMKRWPGGPSSLRVPVVVRAPGAAPACDLSAVASDWTAVEEKFREASEGERATRVVRWMVRRRIATGIFASGVLLDVSACPEGLGDSAVVMVEGTDESLPYPAAELARSRRVEAQRATVIAAREERSRGEAEAEWRRAFQTLRGRVAKLEAERNLLRNALDRQDDVNLVSRARSELPRVEQDLARAREALDDLERQASFQSVPREWRQ